MDRQADIAALNQLALRLIDIKRRCTHAQRCERDPDAILDIQRKIDLRTSLLRDAQAKVRELQGRPATSLPGVHLTRDPQLARVNIERGESELKHDLDRVLSNAQLDTETRAFLDEARSAVAPQR